MSVAVCGSSSDVGGDGRTRVFSVSSL